MQAGRAVARPPAPRPEPARPAARSREEEARPGVEGSSTAEGRNAGVREHGRSVEDTRTSLVEPVRAARGGTRECTLPPAAGSVAEWGKRHRACARSAYAPDPGMSFEEIKQRGRCAFGCYQIYIWPGHDRARNVAAEMPGSSFSLMASLAAYRRHE